MLEEKLARTGLTSFEARAILERDGPNELKEKSSFSSWKSFISQFASPLIYILVIAGIISLFLKNFADAVVIFVAVLVNSLLGFYQERKAGRALAFLKTFIVSKAKVTRDGILQEIATQEIVKGDLVTLTIGARVPADGFLIESNDFSVNESILTGESMPVFKKQKAFVCMGTTVVTGIAKMIVTSIGKETRIGKIGQHVSEIKEEKTPLQSYLGNLAKTLAFGIVLIILVIFFLGRARGYDFFQMFTTSVALAVSAIPEGLSITFTVILALGMQRILKKKAVIRRLLAAETLGSVSVICVDKTGTLTEGKMKVVGDELTDRKLGINAAILCNDLRDPLETSMWDWAKQELEKEKLDPEVLKEKFPRLDEIPFSHKTKIIATLHPGLLLVSGAPEVVLAKSKMPRKEFQTWLEKFEEYGKQGLRLVGFAKGLTKNNKILSSDLKNLEWLGVLLYEDPVRIGVEKALRLCQEAGVKIKVITGDFAPTAEAVVRKLGMMDAGVTKTMTGEELEKLNHDELKEKINETLLFARTTPEQKLKIVQCLKEAGEIVAMTGDGVNDAPALKAADIGIVVGNASDVARETADMVLLNSDFGTIVHAIEGGRNILENMKKVIVYFFSQSFTETVLVTGSLLLSLPLPITAGQILWLNLIEASFPAVSLAFEGEDEELMGQDPKTRVSMISASVKSMAFLTGLANSLILILFFYFLRRNLSDLALLQTMMFVSLGINSLFSVYVFKSLRRPLFEYKLFDNRFLNRTAILGLSLLILAIYFKPLGNFLRTQPLDLGAWLVIVPFCLLNILVMELIKRLSMVDYKK